MNPNIIIFHGTGGYHEEGWLPWLKTELNKSGIEVEVPQFPTPVGQSLEAWLEVLKPYEAKIHRQSILIGHSLGGLFLLRYLERIKHKVSAAIFVAATIGVKPIKFYEADEKFSPGFDFDWNIIKNNAEKFSVFHSDTDPYVDLANGKELARNLGVSLNFIPNSGHFNAAAGYREFPQLLNEVRRLLRGE